MKKALLILGIMVGLFLVFMLGMAMYFSLSGIPSYEPQSISFKVSYDSAQIQRGEDLSSMVCQHCHLDPNTMRLTGRKVEDIDPAFGKVFSQNITQHPEKGIGKWKDEELAYFLKTGVRPDGSFAPPYMPKFPLLADEDLAAIIAYLRSGADLVQANPTEPPKSEPSLMTKALCRMVFKPFPFESVPAPDTTDPVIHGKYLATAAYGCFQCHSADFKTNSDLDPETSEGYMGGGNKLYDLQGQVVYSPNITLDMETGIGSWTEAEFVELVRFGRRKGQPPVAYPMLPYSRATEKEVKAIYAYLKTVDPISNQVEQPNP